MDRYSTLSLMKRQITFLFILFFTRLAIGQSWVQLSDFPSSERDDGVSFVIGNKSYCGTGFKVGWITTGDFYSFDMNLEEWSSISPMPIGEERQYACAFSNQNLGYVFGGVNSSGTALNDLWAYDTLANNWTEKNSKPGIGLAGATVIKINDTAYFIGGANASTTASNEVWAYCITNDSWVQKNNFLFGGRWRASGASVNGKGYLLFGKNENEKFCNELYEYNPSLDTWSEKSAFPSIGRVYSTLQSVSNNLIAFAGIDTFANCYNDCWRYNVSQGV
jgi:N-acetylneuraminic acid mutarotase